MSVVVIVPIKTVPGLNAREHWRAKAKRVAAERRATAKALLPFWIWITAKSQCILLTRHAKKCDDDNLQGALKGVRDEVAAWLGIDDGDARVQYCYAQTTCKRGEEHVSITFGHVTELMQALAAIRLLRRDLEASNTIVCDYACGFTVQIGRNASTLEATDHYGVNP